MADTPRIAEAKQQARRIAMEARTCFLRNRDQIEWDDLIDSLIDTLCAACSSDEPQAIGGAK